MGDSDSHLIEAMAAYMTRCMAGHDPSHNPAHVHRVVSLAHRILSGETAALNPDDKSKYSKTVVTLAALLHDIGDHKYLPPSPLPRDATTTNNASSMATTFSGSSPLDPTQLVYKALTEHGADEELASRVQTIVNNVSYSNEIRNPARVQSLIATPGYHELAIVQDADRLDAIGAVGIARTFTYLGSQGLKRTEQSGPWELEESIKHFEEKLEKLECMMKTETGRKIARERTRRLKVFKEWWIDETASLDA